MHSAESGETINTQSTMDDLKASANEGKPKKAIWKRKWNGKFTFRGTDYKPTLYSYEDERDMLEQAFQDGAFFERFGKAYSYNVHVSSEELPEQIQGHWIHELDTGRKRLLVVDEDSGEYGYWSEDSQSHMMTASHLAVWEKQKKRFVSPLPSHIEMWRGRLVDPSLTYSQKNSLAVKQRIECSRRWHGENISYFHTEGSIMRHNGENLWRVMVPDNSKYGHDHMAVTEEEARQIVADHYADPNWKDCELALCPDARKAVRDN
jgi:hypothetical protein